MPKYPYRDLGTGFDRNFRNDLNANFDDIEQDFRDVDARMTQIENDLDARIDNIVADAGSSNTEIVDARYDSINNVTYPTLKDRLDDTSDKIGILSDSTGINVKTYGAIGDGAFHKIKDVNPAITLAQVQALDPNATLDNSIDWYAIQKAINENSSILISGNFIIDRPLWIKQGNKSIIGVPGKSTISNIGVGTPAFIVGDTASSYIDTVRFYDLKITGRIQANAMSGNGLEARNVANLTLQNCHLSGHGDNGFYSGTSHNLWIARFINVRFEGNKNNGVLIQHTYSHQKNNISFIGCRAQGNGYDNNGVNQYNAGNTTTTYGHGISISGTAIFIGSGTDCEGNSGAGIYLGGDTSQQVMDGIHITGCYFEPNKLADIYINNANTMIKSSVIGGNFRGSDQVAGSQYGHLYIAIPTNKKYSYIEDTYGNSLTKDLLQANINLFKGGEFGSKNLFNVSNSLYSYICGDGIKLTQNNNVLANFGGPDNTTMLFNPKVYVVEITYYWNKVTTSSSVILGLIKRDYDGNTILNSTVPSKRTTSYAALTQNANVGDTVLYFDNLSGWDTAQKTNLSVYNVVLSNGYTVGTDYSNTVISASNIANINTTNNTVTLTSPLSFSIPLGTKCCLSFDPTYSGASFQYNYLSFTGQLATESFIVDCTNVEMAKHIRYMTLYLALNGAIDPGDFLAIRKIRVYELPINGTIGANISISAGATSYSVTGINQPDTKYKPDVAPSWNTTWWITNKTSNGFTINFGTAPSSTSTLDWSIRR